MLDLTAHATTMPAKQVWTIVGAWVTDAGVFVWVWRNDRRRYGRKRPDR